MLTHKNCALKFCLFSYAFSDSVGTQVTTPHQPHDHRVGCGQHTLQYAILQTSCVAAFTAYKILHLQCDYLDEAKCNLRSICLGYYVQFN